MEEQKSKRGGYRAKAGRPKGSKNLVQFKKALKEYITEAELAHMVKRAKEWAKKDPKMLQFLLEQVFGKARGTVGIDGGENKPIAIGMLLDTLENKEPIKVDYWVGDPKIEPNTTLNLGQNGTGQEIIG